MSTGKRTSATQRTEGRPAAERKNNELGAEKQEESSEVHVLTVDKLVTGMQQDNLNLFKVKQREV